MIRVLQCVNNMHRAGLETILMNYYRHIDRSQIQFDFLMHRSERSDYDDEIEELGGKIYRAPRLYPQNYPAYFQYMERFFADHPEYKIVHSHIDEMSFLPLMAAKCAGVPVRIAHSHTTSIDLDFKYPMKQLFRHLLPITANYRCACGKNAGEFLFENSDYTIIPNAIDIECYQSNEGKRKWIRRQIGVENKYVIGHVGRFAYAKNHEFLIRIFDAVRKREPDAVLVLVGSGEKEEKIKAYVKKMRLEDCVIFLGNRSDVNDIYQAMDVFVLPSRFEGVPVVGIEAQYAGLPCILSGNISREVRIADNCRFLGIDRPVEEWATMILNCRSQQHPRIISDQFDISKAHVLLEEYYKKAAAEL